jgi:hypothetical protein
MSALDAWLDKEKDDGFVVLPAVLTSAQVTCSSCGPWLRTPAIAPLPRPVVAGVSFTWNLPPRLSWRTTMSGTIIGRESMEFGHLKQTIGGES